MKKNFDAKEQYETGFKVDELMNGVSGIETKLDHFAIDFDLNILKNRISDFILNNYTPEDRKKRFDLKDNEEVVENAVTELRQKKDWINSFVPCFTRPFDLRWIIYDSTILLRDSDEIMAGMNKQNIGLILARQSKEDFAALVSNCVCTHKTVTVYDTSFIFPLYLYPESTNQTTFDQKPTRTPNFNPTIVQQIAAGLGLGFTSEKEIVGEVCYMNSEEVRPEFRTHFAPIDLLDYIYAVLHSPTYREKYKEFLKIDFPRVPYPTNATTFWKLVKLGRELRKLQLLESPLVNQYITQYPIDGDNKITKVKWEDGRVYINDTQYFDNVLPVAWQFYIGGYQPAQRWLKDRKDRELNFDDILHYQQIIVALAETDRLMKEIDKVEIE